MQYVGAKRYHRTAHEAWHPKSPQHLRRSLPPTSRPASRVYIHVHTCTSTTIHMHSREMHICMHASSCSICRIAPRGRQSKPACHSYRKEDKRYIGTRSRRARRCVCVYTQGALPCLQGVHRACKQADGRCSMRPYARPGQRQRSGRSPFVMGR
jgi:hypothetical protein